VPEPFASVLIPSRAPGPGIEQVLDAVYSQRPGFTFEVIIVDSGSPESNLERMRRFPLALHCIPPHEFGHGRTRNLLARLSRGQVLLYLSQDAEPASPSWMETLVAPLEDPIVAGAYARQLPRPDADPFARFFCAEMYGPSPTRLRRVDGLRGRLQDIFFSNVSSAIRADVRDKVPFRNHVSMSEDQYWASDVLNAGYELVYEPAAHVKHSHNYTLQQLFHRNWTSGASLHGLVEDSLFDFAARGWAHCCREATFLAYERYWSHLVRLPVYEAERALAFGAGVIWAGASRSKPAIGLARAAQAIASRFNYAPGWPGEITI
jgi:rhamnosyltransferase